MTGIFFFQAKNDSSLPDDLQSTARCIRHRGKHRTCIIDSARCFAAVFLNKPQKDNLCVVDGTQKEMASSFSVLDGYIDTGSGSTEKDGSNTGERSSPIAKAWSLYKTGGINALSQLSGPFSLVIKDKEVIIIARDSIGSNPLYYINDDEKLVIASELKAFRGIGNSPRLLEPGTAFLTNGRSSCVRRFDDNRSLLHEGFPCPAINVSELALELRTLFDRAIKRSIPRSVKTSALLSGGLDSSVICAVALNYIPVLDAYVASYGDSDDLINARRFADRYNDRMRLHVVKYSLDDMLRSIPDVIQSLETFDAALVRSALPMHIACSNIDPGTDVLLTGEGCDELFAGYSYLQKVEQDKLDAELLHLLDVEHATGLQRVDRIPYRFGIEARAPWFDAELASFAFRLPPNTKIKRDRGVIIEKWIVRETFKHLLPVEIAWRKKAKFSQGAGSELVLRDYLQEKISDDEFAKEKEVRPGLFARSKEELYYWRVFEEFFEPSTDFVKKMPRTEQFSI